MHCARYSASRGARALALAAAWALLAALPACLPLPKERVPLPAPRREAPPPPAREKPAPPPREAETAPPPAPQAEPRPGRARAAASLTAQGRELLARGRVEAALTALERATSLDPGHGPALYWLAEAWLRRGDPAQAREYHRLARLRLAGSSAWQERLVEQRRRIRARLP
jgi:tetratricopeptide (TPR) repeat protein